MIRVGAIDDDRMLLDGLRTWMAPVGDVEVVAVAPDVAGYEEMGVPADVILLDLNLRDRSDPAVNVGRLVASGAAVLVVSAIPDAEHVLNTLQAGAAGYVTKDHDLAGLAAAIRDVAAGRTVVTPELALAIRGDHRPSRPRLSPQELAVVTAYAQGCTLDTAARRAGVAYGTAREYLERVKRKYQAAGRPASTKLDLAARVREDQLEFAERRELEADR